MDPDVALAAARAHARAAEAITPQSKNSAVYLLQELATALDHYQTLDEWITKGGFLPKEWAATVGALPAV